MMTLNNILRSSALRLDWLDFMKGVAILIVVVGHIAHDSGTNYSFGKLIIVCEMPLFFMLSGILANRMSKRTISENLKRKIKSLGVPFIVVGGIYAVCTRQVEIFLLDLYHLSYWFLISLLSCWLMFIPLQRFITYVLKKQRMLVRKFGEILLFIPFLVYKIISEYIPTVIDDAFSLNFTFTYYRFFVIGYFIGLYYKKFNNNVSLFSCVGLTIVEVALTLNNSPLLAYVPMMIQQLVLSVCLAGTIYVVYRKCPLCIRKSVIRYGKGSLLIYLFHYMIITEINCQFVDGGTESITLLYIIIMAVVISEIILFVTYPIENNSYLRRCVLGKF